MIEEIYIPRNPVSESERNTRDAMRVGVSRFQSREFNRSQAPKEAIDAKSE